MKVKFDTKKLIIFEEIKGASTIIYRQHKEDETEERVKVSTQIGDKITYHTFDSENIKVVEFIGFDELPGIVSKFGYGFENRQISNFLRYKIKKSDATKLVIQKDGNSIKKRKTLFINVDELEELQSKLNVEQRACNDTKNILIKNYLAETFPDLSLDFTPTNNNKELVLRNLNKKLIDKLTADEVEQIGKFYVEAALKYKRPDVVRRMVASLQKSTQLLSLQEIVNKYEKLMNDNPPESTWQTFFDEYITLFDNRYFRKLKYKNIATGITKYPDLVLVDIYGYVDFYELKKSSTKILQYDSSHKTFYWSKEFSMVIAQASDYIQKVKENSLSYAKAIKEQTATADNDGIDVNIISPRAIVVAGSSSELNTLKKQNHFKNLRERV